MSSLSWFQHALLSLALGVVAAPRDAVADTGSPGSLPSDSWPNIPAGGFELPTPAPLADVLAEPIRCHVLGTDDDSKQLVLWVIAPSTGGWATVGTWPYPNPTARLWARSLFPDAATGVWMSQVQHAPAGTNPSASASVGSWSFVQFDTNTQSVTRVGTSRRREVKRVDAQLAVHNPAASRPQRAVVLFDDVDGIVQNLPVGGWWSPSVERIGHGYGGQLAVSRFRPIGVHTTATGQQVANIVTEHFDDRNGVAEQLLATVAVASDNGTGRYAAHGHRLAFFSRASGDNVANLFFEHRGLGPSQGQPVWNERAWWCEGG